MIYYLLGLITGILTTGLLVVLALILSPKIHRTVNQGRAKLQQKGKILEEPSQEFTDWVESLPKE